MQIKMAVLCIALLSIHIPHVIAYEDDKRLWVVVQATSADERTSIAGKGLCIEEITDEWVAGIVDADSIDGLIKSDFVIKQSMPLAQYIQLISDAQTIRFNYQFTTFTNMVAKLQKLVADNQEILTLCSVGRSCEGRDLWMLRLSTPGSISTDKPGILFVGNHHAREHISMEICLSLAQYLCEHKHSPTIAHLLNSVDIFILPMLNPDGVVYDFSQPSFACWRKNRRINQDRSIGVDLNRNYAYMWDGPGKANRMASENYSGPRPFSEPETQAMRSFLDAHKNVKIFISYHSYGNLILYPWGCKNSAVENLRDRNVYRLLAQKMASSQDIGQCKQVHYMLLREMQLIGSGQLTTYFHLVLN